MIFYLFIDDFYRITNDRNEIYNIIKANAGKVESIRLQIVENNKHIATLDVLAYLKSGYELVDIVNCNIPNSKIKYSR